MTELKEVQGIVVGLVVLFIFIILYSAWSGNNLLAAEKNFTLERPTVEIIGKIAVGEAGVTDLGGWNKFTYTIPVSANLKLSHAASEGFTLIPVLTFKGQDIRGAEFIFAKDSDTITYTDQFTITTEIPPIQAMGYYDGKYMVEGQEFWYETPDLGVYKFGLPKLSQGIPIQTLEKYTPEFIIPCKATYYIECKDVLKTTTLQPCKTNKPDYSCRETFNMCGGSVTITQYGALDCDAKTNDYVEVQTVGGDVPWGDYGEKVTLSFFEKSVCTDFASYLDDLKACALSGGTSLTASDVTFKIDGVT